MYPSRFDYVVPQSVGEAVSLLAEHGDEGRCWRVARASSR